MALRDDNPRVRAVAPAPSSSGKDPGLSSTGAPCGVNLQLLKELACTHFVNQVPTAQRGTLSQTPR